MSAKESSSASYRETTVIAESLEGKQNSFVVFINDNRNLFKNNSSLTYKLRDKEKRLRDSPTVNSIVEKTINLALVLQPGREIDEKKMPRFREEINNFLFSNSDRTSEFILNSLRQFNHRLHLTPESQALTEALEEKINNFQEEVYKERSPLVSGILESRAELMEKLEDFFASNSSSLFAFKDFISDKKNYKAERETIRPFLVSLAETEERLAKNSKEGILGETVRKWVKEISEKPTPDFLDKFVVSIRSTKIFEWLKFSTSVSAMFPHTAEDRDERLTKNIADFLKDNCDVLAWPSELKNAYDSFVKSKYYSAQSVIKKELGQFRKPL